MHVSAGSGMLVSGLGFAACAPAPSGGLPSYTLAKRCAAASGSTARAQQHPDHNTGNVHATAEEVAITNRCVKAAKSGARPQANPQPASRTTAVRTTGKPVRAARSTLPFPSGYPSIGGDVALWQTLTLEQQRRAILFLQSGSTIQSSLQGD